LDVNTPALRIIDANANRALEALRVLEDLARFALDDGELSEGLKRLRHELSEAIPAELGKRLASRDTPGDVGTRITTPRELERASLGAVAAANASRLAEALRSMEEVAKTMPTGNAPALEAIRYRSYTLSQRVMMRMGSPRRRQWRVCVLITASVCTRHDWLTVARHALEGGAEAIQLREKDLPEGELLRRARGLVKLAREINPEAAVVINDRVDIALLSDADGVHVGQDDLAIEDVRRLAGFSLMVGVSTGSVEQAAAAARAGADVIGIGPMYATTTKHKPVIAGPGLVSAVMKDAAAAHVPHLAIGGITVERVAELREAGCRGVAVSAAVCSAADPREATRALVRAMEG
jgi:thiamine-phosphate pyrophosphorylase